MNASAGRKRLERDAHENRKERTLEVVDYRLRSSMSEEGLNTGLGVPTECQYRRQQRPVLVRKDEKCQ